MSTCEETETRVAPEVATEAAALTCCPLCRAALTAAAARFEVTSAPIPTPTQLHVCAACGNGFNQPRPSAAVAAQFFAAAYHESGDPQLWSGAEMHPVFRRYLQVVGRYWRRGERRADAKRWLLDVGCGAGQFLALAREAGWAVRGVEVSRQAADYARAQHGLEVIEAPLAAAALPKSSCDVITSWKVFDHVDDPIAFLAACRAALRPGGVLALSVANLDFHRRVEGAWRRLGAREHWRPPTVFHNFSFSARGLRHVLQAQGFSDVSIVNAPLDPRVPAVVRRVGVRCEPLVRGGVTALAALIYHGSVHRCVWGPSLLALARAEPLAPAPLRDTGPRAVQ
ncbi:MAG: class I SAM-dependent methyltransferase [Planctomycetota bacterium]